MNKSELLKALEAKLGSRKAASDALEAVVDTIIREVAKGGSVGITGFGTFEKVARAARTGRNPRTGETVRIRKTSVPKFRPGTQFKEYVAAPSKMPKRAPSASVPRPAPRRRRGCHEEGDDEEDGSQEHREGRDQEGHGEGNDEEDRRQKK